MCIFGKKLINARFNTKKSNRKGKKISMGVAFKGRFSSQNNI